MVGIHLQRNKNLCVAFEFFGGEVFDIPPGYKEIYFHLIFDINMGKKLHKEC